MPRANHPDADGSVLEITRTKPAHPPKYTVVMFNDDYTPANFVVQLLISVFRLGPEAAAATMLAVHTKGAAPCGTYPRDVAETKLSEAVSRVLAARHPLKLEIQPE